MRALAAVEKGVLDWVDVPVPEPGPYQALVKIEVCGICNSTDWKLAKADVGWAAPPPLLIGHESVGTVVQVGDKVRKFKIGDRVTRPYAGKPGGEYAGYGVFFGGFADYGIVDDAPAQIADGLEPGWGWAGASQSVVPAGLSPLDAASAISLSETASFMQNLGAYGGKRVVIAGTGIAGLTMAFWAKLAGASRVLVLGRRAARLEMAKALAADEALDIRAVSDAQIVAGLGGLADYFVDAVGDPTFTTKAAAVLAPGGAFAPYGLLPKDADQYAPLPETFRQAPMVIKEQETYPWVADLIKRGILRTEVFRTNVWSTDEAVAAFAAVERGEAMKGFVVFR